MRSLPSRCTVTATLLPAQDYLPPKGRPGEDGLTGTSIPQSSCRCGQEGRRLCARMSTEGIPTQLFSGGNLNTASNVHLWGGKEAMLCTHQAGGWPVSSVHLSVGLKFCKTTCAFIFLKSTDIIWRLRLWAASVFYYSVLRCSP